MLIKKGSFSITARQQSERSYVAACPDSTGHCLLDWRRYQISTFAYLALRSMNSRLGATSSPISIENR